MLVGAEPGRPDPDGPIGALDADRVPEGQLDGAVGTEELDSNPHTGPPDFQAEITVHVLAVCLDAGDEPFHVKPEHERSRRKDGRSDH